MSDPGRETFLTEVRRLRREVREVGHQLDRVEADMRKALDHLLREQHDAYR